MIVSVCRCFFRHFMKCPKDGLACPTMFQYTLAYLACSVFLSSAETMFSCTHTHTHNTLLLQELLELLNSDDATGIVDRADARETSASGKGVLTNDELELLLDRSELTWRTQKEQLASKKRKKIDVEPKTGLCFTVVDDETKDNGDWVGSVN